MTTESAALRAARLDEVSLMLNEISGGSRDREANEVAVKPTGPSGEFRVTMVTPDA